MKAHPETTSPAVLDDLPRGPDPAREGVATAVFRHWRLIAGLAIIGALGAFVLSQRLTPLYTATATVMIDPHEPKLAAQATDPMSFMPPSEEDVRQNEVAVIRSRNLAAKVISGLKLLQLSEFNPSLRPPSRMRELLTRAETMLEGVLRAIGLGSNIAPQHGSPVERERERAIDIFLTHLTTAETSASRVIDIRFSSANPERAAAVANAVANQYIGLKVAQDLAEARAETEALERQIHHLNDIIRAEEYAIERVRTEQGRVPADNLRVVSELMTNLNRELVVAVADRAAAEARIAELNKAQHSRDIDSFASVLASPLIQRLQEQAAELDAKLHAASTLYGRNYSGVLALRLQLDGLHGRINNEIAKIAASYRIDLAVAQAKETHLRQMLASAKAEMAGAADSDVEVRAVEREAKANKSVMDQMVARLNDTMPALIKGERADAQVISSPAVPIAPSFPPKLVMTMMGFLIFGTAGVGLAVFRERNNDSIRTTLELRRMTNARVLGWLPALRRVGRLQSPPATVLNEPKSMFVENLRTVWFQIDQFPVAQAKVLLVTSATPGEGKSSVAMSLTRLLAVSGREVLLIDADLRHPGLHRTLNLPRCPGLAQVLEGTRTATGVLQVDGQSGAAVMTAGETEASPPELLRSPRLATTLADMAARFDRIIIDTPPILAVHDAAILVPVVDMTILVVRSGIHAATLTTALQRLQDLNIPLGGIILTKVETKGPSHPAYAEVKVISREIRKYYSR